MDPMGLIIASLWGLLGGIVTTIPLGPTGALVLVQASQGRTRGVVKTILGFTIAHLLLQLVYHFGLARLLETQDSLIRYLAIPGVVMMAFMGLSYLKRAGRQYRYGPPELNVSSRPSASLPKTWQSPLVQSFSLALLNPVLLVWMVANVAMFLEFLPSYREPINIIVLLMATLFGTNLYYAAFGYWVHRNSGRWSPKKRALAEGMAGLIMIFAGVSLALRF